MTEVAIMRGADFRWLSIPPLSQLKAPDIRFAAALYIANRARKVSM
jgi:hypothetical protein